MDHKIKVLFLDIDNTLLDFDAGAAWAMNLCFKKACCCTAGHSGVAR